ncbi:MAG: hypothetical protein V1645_05115, partial [archaeon]
MVIVKKMYGVSDGGFMTIAGYSLQEVLGGETGQIITHVGKDLREELMTLPKKTRVGVQYFDEFCDGGMPYRRGMKIRKKDVHIPKHTAGYWTEILGICKMRDLEVVFLDHYQSLRETSKRLVEKERDLEGIQALEKTIQSQPDNMGLEKVKREQTEKLYRTEVEIEHINTVTRADKILEAIVKERPEIVILGSGHADYFMANPGLMETIKLKFENYAREQYEAKVNLDNLPEYMARPPQIFGKLAQNAEPDKAALALREKVERQNKAITLGRIIASKEPRWIGTWSKEIPPRGLFEVYVEQEIKTFHGVRAFKGTVEDIFGSAKFTGSTDGLTLILEKKYREEAVAVGGYAGPIKYEATLSG